MRQNNWASRIILGPREDRHRLIGVAGRADRAAQNCVVSLALFAPAVLAVQVQGLNDSITLLAAQVFLGARVAYVFLYVASIPVLRSIAFLIGLSATVYLYYVAL